MPDGTPDRTSEGLLKVYPSPRPHGTTTWFTGASDDLTDPENPVIAGGNKLIFNMLSTDSSKSVDMVFSENVYIKDGYMITDTAPFGAYLDIDIVHPTFGVVGSFGKKIPVFGSGWFPLDTEDRGLLTYGLILRITLYNSSGSNGEDPASAFKLAGRVEMYRTNTV